MSWIREEEVNVANVIKCMSINPRAMEAVRDSNMAITFGASALTRVQEEAIATAVSVINKCRYWTMSHGEFLRQHSDDPTLASHIMHDSARAELDPQTRGMLDFAVKLTQEPSSMEQGDVQVLRDLGLSDEQILSTVLITCVFNFMTRLADGLGVEITGERQESVEGWISGPAAMQEWLMVPKS